MPDPSADRCALQGRVFTALGPVVFRRAESDGAPAMVVSLGERLAALPLAALRREFAIDPASPDGRMLDLIARALDYVAGLRLGDPLPPEVLSGEASWRPEPRHRRIVDARLRQELLAAFGSAAEAVTPDRLETDPHLRTAVQAAFDQAATALGLPGAEDVLGLFEQLAEELAYIEALRETLLARVHALHKRLQALGLDWHGNAERQETLMQVRRLAGVALKQLATRFAEIDAQTGEVVSTLRHFDRQRAFIRDHRDWLYRSSLAWEPILAEWEVASPWLDDAAWARLSRTYQFLAPRFMPVQEWESATGTRPARQPRLLGPVMQW
jgi:hypothetical protein